jgi:hypothetical protein
MGDPSEHERLEKWLASIFDQIEDHLARETRSDQIPNLLAQAQTGVDRLEPAAQGPHSLKLALFDGLHNMFRGDHKNAGRKFREVIREGAGVEGSEGVLFAGLVLSNAYWFVEIPAELGRSIVPVKENQDELDRADALAPKIMSGSPLIFQALDCLARKEARDSPEKARILWEKRIQLAEASGDESAVIHGKVQLATHFELYEKNPAKALAVWEDIVASQERFPPERRHGMFDTHLNCLAKARSRASR